MPRFVSPPSECDWSQFRTLDPVICSLQTTVMADAALPNAHKQLSLAQQLALGFCYWLAFVLVLEPDNILKATQASQTLAWTQELIRIAGASTLGASVTPVLFALVRRYPIEGPEWIKRAAIELICCTLISALLIGVSCLLADWLLASERRPLGVALPQEFQANWTLLTFAIGGLLAIAHAIRSLNRDNANAVVRNDEKYLASVQVKSRGRVIFVELADVDWIETQGNYLALHAGPVVHLIRESLAQFESRLDPMQFARIHRRIMVAVNRIGAVQSLGAGDAELTLKDGTKLRMSRGFRDRIGAI